MFTEMAMKYLFLASTVIITVNYCSSLAQGSRYTLRLEASLSKNQTLLSRNGMFELGFFNPGGTNNWYVGIWYAPVNQRPVVVWVANRDNPLTNMAGVLEFSNNGHLRLVDGNRQSAWTTDNAEKGSRAVLTDPGNLIILSDGHNKSVIVWESFANPTDTWLPGMKMWKGMKLTSWKSSSDPATGLFSFGIDTSPGKTQLMLFYNITAPYWSSGEYTGHNRLSKVPELESDKIIQVSFVTFSPSIIYVVFGVNPIDHIVTGRLLVNEKGEYQFYLWRDDGTWSLRWSTYRGQCTDYPLCGAYGLCNLNNVCSCVQGFAPKHDSHGWWSSGCARRTPLKCSVTEGTTDDFFEAENQYLPEKEAVLIRKEATQEGCRTACLTNCFCTAFGLAISDPPLCRLWFGHLFGMSVSSKAQSVFIRVAASELPHLTSEQSKKAPALRILLSAAGSLVVVSALLVAAFILWKRRKKDIAEDVPISLKKFSYKELRIATENFNHKLGSGGFGSVFKGTLPDSTLVAVKRLEGRTQAEKQFRAEIITTGMIQHVNLVRLWGFCVEKSQRLLVYEYMPNGSLNSFLFSKLEEDANHVVDWKTRFQIALGTARGIVYLHEECRDRIIHCDIKPENILLDGNFSPKVGDFGLAKLIGRDFSRVLTTTRGTRGYLAPEWISGLTVTSKVDVYSFGMTLLEIISGRRNLDLRVEESRLYFPTWASCQIQRGNMMALLDARIAGEANVEEVRRVAVAAVLCIQENEDERPSMGEVLKILDGKIEAPLPESLSFLSIPSCQVVSYPHSSNKL